MHRAYEFDVTEFLVNGENTIKAVFPPYDAYIKEKSKEKKINLLVHLFLAKMMIFLTY